MTQEEWHIPQNANPRLTQQIECTARVCQLNYPSSLSPLLPGPWPGDDDSYKALLVFEILGFFFFFSPHHGNEVQRSQWLKWA